jgi:hypothetical protein
MSSTICAEENWVLREQGGERRLRFTDARATACGARQEVRPQLLAEIVTLVPTTLLPLHRKLIAQKYDGSTNRKPGGSMKQKDVTDLVIRMA